MSALGKIASSFRLPVLWLENSRRGSEGCTSVVRSDLPVLRWVSDPTHDETNQDVEPRGLRGRGRIYVVTLSLVSLLPTVAR